MATAFVVAFGGALFAIDAWTWSPAKADHAEEPVRTFIYQPYGRLTLLVVGLLLIAFGLYSLAEAKYRRVAIAPSWVAQHHGGYSLLRSSAPLALGVLLLVGVLATVGSLLTGVLSGSPVTALDAWVSWWFFAHRTPTLNQLSQWGSYLAETITAVAVTAVAVVLLRWWMGRWRESLVVVAAIVGELSIFLSVTALIHRQRPSVPRLEPSVLTSTSSFPSGHTGAAMALYGVLVQCRLQPIPPAPRYA